MKILVELKNISLLKDYINCDGLIINTKYSISSNPCYPIYELELNKIISWCKANNKEIIFRIDKIFDEKEIDDVIEFVNEKIEYNFIYTDFAIFTHFKKLSRLNQLYYFAQTYLCNKEDIAYYTSKEVKTLISNELSIDEIKIITNSVKENVGILAYGYFPILYTRREIVSLYNDYSNNVLNKKMALKKFNEYELKEELRSEKYKLVENDDFSCIYSISKMFIDYDIDLTKFDFIYISNSFIDDKETKKVIDFYHNIKEGSLEDNEGITFENTFKSFLYKTNEIL